MIKPKVNVFQPSSVDTRELSPLQRRLYRVIFQADSVPGRLFDIFLLIAIILSVLVIMLESVKSIYAEYGQILRTLEWIFTGLFTVEYMLRIYCVGKPRKYVFSFFGIIDFLAIIPTYLTLFVTIGPGLNVIRILRFVRIYNILKLGNFVDSGNVIMSALYASRHKIVVFLTGIFTLVIFVGGLVYFVESVNPNSQFTSIPKSIYWAIVTITTVGFGDIVPITPIGQFLSALLMISGYAIIAVPTGIVTSEIVKSNLAISQQKDKTSCHKCNNTEHDDDAMFCKRCGSKLIEEA
jgi:voltage-gated potassium channel